MSRTYWVDSPLAWPEGYPLDAALCRDVLIGDTSAVMDESGWETCIVLGAYDAAVSGWYFGPIPVPIRFDRNGLLRAVGITPLCASVFGNVTLRAWLTPTYRAPQSWDDSATWTVSQPPGPDLAWQTEAIITPARDLVPDQRRHRETSASSYEARSRIVYVTFDWSSVSYMHRFGGCVIREVVET